MGARVRDNEHPEMPALNAAIAELDPDRLRSLPGARFEDVLLLLAAVGRAPADYRRRGGRLG